MAGILAVAPPPLFFGIIFVLALGLVCAAIVIRRFLPAPQFLVTPKPWGLRELGLAVAILAAIFLFCNALYTAVAVRRQMDITDLTPLIIPIEFVLRLAFLAAFDTYFRRRQINLRTAFGLDSTPAGHAIGWGLLFALAILPPVSVLLFATHAFLRIFRIQPSQQPIIEFFLTTDSTLLLVLLVIFAVVLAPVFEELLFRGFAYPALKQRFGLVPALLLVSVVFALNHLHAQSLLPLFVLALGLGLAYELTGSLLAPITMHAAFNGLMVLQVLVQRAHP
jgi:membrane protease YdiL (CAAX protease family)